MRCIFYGARAYDRGMKKTFLAAVLGVAALFVSAAVLCFQALSAPQTVFSEEDSGMKIVLDAGHGGIDGGVVGKTTGARESDLNLAITLKLADELDALGFDVVLTRKTEAGLYDTASSGFKKRDMQRRKEIIEATKPALVLSIHQNRYATQSTRGAQVFYLASNEKSTRLARCLQNGLNALYETEGVKHRKIMAGDYFILKCAPCPSVIIECGFLSSPADEALLLNDEWQRRLAQNIAAGVMRYLSDSVS